MKMRTWLLAGFLLARQVGISQQQYQEQFRPQVHFSPAAHWTNDPNGMVYYGGVYHLFFQYYPDSTVWGPMHWGHATSPDMIHWKERPVALYPDSLGYIFSGSAVVDEKNTSGLGTNGHAPLVAIYTSHDPAGERQHRNDYQNQNIAYSLDSGLTWIKYSANPVLKNPGVTDFRDPKVMWYEQEKKWIMTLATKDRITFYSSPDLKSWKKESEFGSDAGAHGGVWECPDLFSLNYNGKKVWVLIVNLNPGGPNKGSATQYFLGSFDGNKFTASDLKTRWLDYGPDEYAGITWSNTGSRKIFLGWMSNWMYANVVPTVKWRNAMTIPRELKLKMAGGQLLVCSEPVAETEKIETSVANVKNYTLSKATDLAGLTNKPVTIPCRIDLSMDKIEDFSIVVSNDRNEKVIIGYEKASNQYFIDRTHSGRVDFNNGFAARHTAPRMADGAGMDMSILLDASSAELFADDGMSVMTEIFFPEKPYRDIHIQADRAVLIKNIRYAALKSIWP